MKGAFESTFPDDILLSIAEFIKLNDLVSLSKANTLIRERVNKIIIDKKEKIISEADNKYYHNVIMNHMESYTLNVLVSKYKIKTKLYPYDLGVNHPVTCMYGAYLRKALEYNDSEMVKEVYRSALKNQTTFVIHHATQIINHLKRGDIKLIDPTNGFVVEDGDLFICGLAKSTYRFELIPEEVWNHPATKRAILLSSGGDDNDYTVNELMITFDPLLILFGNNPRCLHLYLNKLKKIGPGRIQSNAVISIVDDYHNYFFPDTITKMNRLSNVVEFTKILTGRLVEIFSHHFTHSTDPDKLLGKILVNCLLHYPTFKDEIFDLLRTVFMIELGYNDKTLMSFEICRIMIYNSYKDVITYLREALSTVDLATLIILVSVACMRLDRMSWIKLIHNELGANLDPELLILCYTQMEEHPIFAMISHGNGDSNDSKSDLATIEILKQTYEQDLKLKDFVIHMLSFGVTINWISEVESFCSEVNYTLQAVGYACSSNDIEALVHICNHSSFKGISEDEKRDLLADVNHNYSQPILNIIEELF
jgi:hypothetical protein